MKHKNEEKAKKILGDAAEILDGGEYKDADLIDMLIDVIRYAENRDTEAQAHIYLGRVYTKGDKSSQNMGRGKYEYALRLAKDPDIKATAYLYYALTYSFLGEDSVENLKNMVVPALTKTLEYATDLTTKKDAHFWKGYAYEILSRNALRKEEFALSEEYRTMSKKDYNASKEVQ